MPSPSLNPFDPEKNVGQDVFGVGEPSTEYLTTIKLEDGSAMVVPSIWWDKEGKPRFFGDLESKTPDEGTVRLMAESYEQVTGKMFPRFENVTDADKFARARSKAGGANNGSILIEPIKVDK